VSGELFDVRLEPVAFGPSGSDDASDAIRWIGCEPQDVQGLVHHLRFIHIAFNKNSFFDIEVTRRIAIITQAKRAIELRKRLEPRIVEKIFVPEVLVGINEFHRGT
jgi:hypothetical protein